MQEQAITENKIRVGRFTSSSIAALVGVGKRPMTEAELAARPKSGAGSKATLIEDASVLTQAALTYIAEKNMERRLGRSLNVESNAHGLTWGKFVERRAFDLLGMEYKLCSADTIAHEEFAEIWSGSPDLVKFDEGGTVVDIKCPITLKSFCQFADCKTMDEVREEHPDGEDYYWQLVSNAILTKSQYAELIVYCPYLSELKEIRDMASNYDGDQNKVAWINWAADADLPYLPDNGYYKNLNVIRFEVPEEDKALLTEKVIAAGKLLVNTSPYLLGA
jgi:hypothetical protein